VSAAARVTFPFRASPLVHWVVAVDADATWRTNDVLSVSSANPGRLMHAGTPSRVTNSPAWPATVPLLQTVWNGHCSSTETISTTSVGSGPMEPATPQPSRPPAHAPSGSAIANDCAKVGSDAPALKTSRETRSIAARMFCWRSATSGSRRKASPPAASRP